MIVKQLSEHDLYFREKKIKYGFCLPIRNKAIELLSFFQLKIKTNYLTYKNDCLVSTLYNVDVLNLHLLPEL